MSIVKTHFGYCPTQNTSYFAEIKYKLSDINTYKKPSLMCVYQEFYKKDCPLGLECPIFADAPEIIKSGR